MEKQIEADLKCYRDCFLLKRAVTNPLKVTAMQSQHPFALII